MKSRKVRQLPTISFVTFGIMNQSLKPNSRYQELAVLAICLYREKVDNALINIYSHCLWTCSSAIFNQKVQ